MLLICAQVRYRTTGGPPVEKNPFNAPLTVPIIKPLPIVAFIFMLLLKNRKYKLIIIKQTPKITLKASSEIYGEKYIAIGIVINEEIITGKSFLKGISFLYFTALYVDK